MPPKVSMDEFDQTFPALLQDAQTLLETSAESLSGLKTSRVQLTETFRDNMSESIGAGDSAAGHLNVEDLSASLDEHLKLKNDPELDNFLHQVDHIADVIKSLASPDPHEQERGLRRADILLHGDGQPKEIDENTECTVKADRSVINKIPDESKMSPDEMGTQAFMKMVEKDANERAESRKIRKEKSDEFRKKGNKLFAQKDYAGALYNYNEAIKLIKDSPCLYNNRALTYIRLGIFSSAVEDCKKALDFEEFSLRARMFMAKSYFLMGETEKCNETLEEAKEKMPGHCEMIDEYEEELFNMGAKEPFDYDLESERRWKAAEKGEFDLGEAAPETKADESNASGD